MAKQSHTQISHQYNGPLGSNWGMMRKKKETNTHANNINTYILMCLYTHIHPYDRLVGLVVKASPSRVEDPGFKSHLRQDLSGSSHTSDLKIGTPAGTLRGAWRYRVSAGTGWPSISIL